MASASTPVLRRRRETAIAPYLHKDGRTWANTTVCTRLATECSLVRSDYLTRLERGGYASISSRSTQKRTKRPPPTAEGAVCWAPEGLSRSGQASGRAAR